MKFETPIEEVVMRSCSKIVLVLSLAFVMAGCNLPVPLPAITPVAVIESPTPVMPLDMLATEQPTLAPAASIPANW